MTSQTVQLAHPQLNTVESRFLEPLGETQIGSRNREFEKSGVREIEGGIKLRLIGRVLFDYE